VLIQALDFARQHCTALSRSRACYGNVQAFAEPQSNVVQFKFTSPGDVVPVNDLKTIQQLSSQRLENDVAFKLIKDNSDWLAKQNDKEYSLQIDKYRKEQKMIRSTYRQIETLTKLNGQLDVTALPAETNRWAEDKNKQDRFNQWLKGLQKDIYLDQAVKVMDDMIGQQNLVKAKTAEDPKKAF